MGGDRNGSPAGRCRCAKGGKRCGFCGENDLCQEVVGNVDPEEVCVDLEEVGSVDLVVMLVNGDMTME